MSHSKSSTRWLARNNADPYVREARAQGLPSRAAFKLEEIHQRDRLLRKGMTVVDLGAAPGGWSQVAAGVVGESGRVFALDLLPLPKQDELAKLGVEFIQGDFREAVIAEQLLAALAGRRVDLLLSDMSPNLCGIPSVDQPRAMHLAELADEFAMRVLNPGASMLVKVFQGSGFDAFHKQLQSHFGTVTIRKPKSSRPESREVYLLARNFKSLSFV